jgi:hypothetical protein
MVTIVIITQETSLHFVLIVIPEHTMACIATANLGIGFKEVGQLSKGVDKDSGSERGRK